MPINLSQLLGDLSLAQAEDMIAQAKAAGAKRTDTLFDILDPVTEVEVQQKRQTREALAASRRDLARTQRETKAESRIP